MRKPWLFNALAGMPYAASTDMATRRDYSVRDTWPVRWSAIWVGALTGVATALMLGLLAVAFGAYAPAGGRLGPEDLGVGDLIAAVCGAFFSYVAAGWVAAKLAGFRDPEPAALHGVIAWLVALPILLVLVSLGAGSLFGVWQTGLAGTPAWVTVPPPGPRAAELAREAAGGGATALMLGLIGSVLGGWLASGAPMTFENPLRARARRASQTA
jgi:hypothetical protein